MQAAVDKGVHIISMSWTIERTDTNADAILQLEKAIGLAASEGILMFCAATDQGGYRDDSLPAAASSTKKLFKIGAAEASGTASKRIGDLRAVDFIFPGHNVEPRGGSNINDTTGIDKHAMTGSSVATALAAGLAAVVLYSVQVGALSPTNRSKHKPITMEDFRTLRRHDRMRDAFLEIGTTDDSDKKYVAVWKCFQEAVRKATGQPPDTVVDIITDVAEFIKKRKI